MFWHIVWSLIQHFSKVRSLKKGHMFLICFASESTLEIYFRKKIQLKHEKVFMYEKS